MAKPTIKNRRGPYYFIDNQPYISVTNILKVIDKPALRWWFGREVYQAMLLDPSLDQSTALAAPYRKSKKAQVRGSTVHKFIEWHKLDKWVDIPAEWEGYVDAFHNFINDHNVEFLEHEVTVSSHEHRYAGTADAVCQFNAGREKWLLDFKTGKGIYDEVTLQLSAYDYALREMGESVDRLGVVLLETGDDDNPTGNYIFKDITPNMDAFLAAKTLYEWKEQSALNKAGYYQHQERLL